MNNWSYKNMIEKLEFYEEKIMQICGVNPNPIGKPFSLTSSCSASSHSKTSPAPYEFIEAEEMQL